MIVVKIEIMNIFNTAYVEVYSAESLDVMSLWIANTKAKWRHFPKYTNGWWEYP